MKTVTVNIILICTYKFFGEVTAVTDLCQPEGLDCTSNNDCCSEYCSKEPDEKLGLCEQACGKIDPNSIQPSFSNGRQFELGGFPWHATFYKVYKGEFYQVCSGTLISHTIVMSSSSCFDNEVMNHKGIYKEKLNLTEYKAAFGKNHENLYDAEDKFAQIIDLETVELHPDYEGVVQFRANEIAAVILKTPVEYTRAVRPICIDTNPEDFEKNLKDGVMGKIVGWRVSKGQENIKRMMVAELPFVSRDECQNRLSELLDPAYFTTDQMCAGDETSNATTCKMDSGGGIFFEDTKTNTYYLRGIRELAAVLCQREEFFRFVKLSAHKDFVEKYLDDCKDVCRRTCGVSSSNLAHPTCSEEKKAEYGEFPWHAEIYKHNADLNSYDPICEGTLISSNAVITVAHCLTTSRQYTYKRNYDRNIIPTLKVGLGKSHRNFNATEDILAQYVDVEDIEFSSKYINTKVYDIAILKLKTKVNYSRTVRPVCIDIKSDNFERQQLAKGALGKIMIWDKKPKDNDVIRVEDVPIIPPDECIRLQYTNLYRLNTKDMICGINRTSEETDCKSYLGGGLVFEDSKTKTYYLRGVGSYNFVPCNNKRFEIFRKVSSHADLIGKYVDDCKRRCRRDRCEPLTSKILHIICLLPNGQSTRCDKPLPTDTRAIFSCNPLSYMEIKKSEYNIINCKNGQWDRPLVDDNCVPAYAECGKPDSKSGQAVILNGKQTEYGDFPWHAAVYEYDTEIDSYKQVCGGTLISHKVVISAAHCFAVEGKNHRTMDIKDLSTMKIGLGKYHRTLNSSEDILAQIIEPENVEIPHEYRSHVAQYANDIAFITLKTQVDYTRAVQPICIDVGPDSIENDQLIKGAMGKVVGWGLTERKSPSETLILVEMAFVPRDECINNISSGLLGFVRNDKICAGDKSSNVTVCTGDSGGGLVFENPKTKAYYLRGIVSIGPKGCKGPDYSLFTKLSSHADLLEKYLRLF